MTMGSVVQEESAGLCGTLKAPTQFPGWPDMLYFTSVVYPPSLSKRSAQM